LSNPTRIVQEEYFRRLLKQHSGSPMATSSESQAHKDLRYQQIAQFLDSSISESPTVHDFGMGLADFGGFLESSRHHEGWTYSGSDILAEYVELAQSRFPESKFHHRDLAVEVPTPAERYDYVILSGVFHQRRRSSITEFNRFMKQILHNAFSMCSVGLVFNAVSPYVDFYQENIHYINLPWLLDFVRTDLSRFFIVHHNYALYEFTIAVFPEDVIRSRTTAAELQKYFSING
jgi:hypothetical protein